MAPSNPVGGDGQFLTFRTGGRLYALPAEQVAEVIRIPISARVPQAPRSLLGLANLRGDVVPLASLSGLLGGEMNPLGLSARAVVLSGSSPVALAVDGVEALVQVDQARIETRQAELAASPGERLTGAFQENEAHDVARILDIQALLASAFTPRERVARRSSRRVETMSDQDLVSEDFGKLVSFEIAGQDYALGLDEVREIIDAPAAIAAVPRSEDLVLGVTAYRDGLLPLLSLRGLLGFPIRAASEREKVVVVHIGQVLVGLVVDRMRAILPADPALIDEAPSLLAARAGGEARISAIYRGDGGRNLVSILQAGKLFKEEIMQRLKGAANETQASAGQASQAELRFVIFRLGEDEFALPIEAVDEVAPAPVEITRVPKTPDFLEGVINLRGEVLPVIDQRRRFDMPAMTDAGRRKLIVVRTERHRAGLIVDSVSEVLSSLADEIAPAPDMAGDTSRLVSGVINLDRAGRLILVLDAAELLSRAERGLLDAFQTTRQKGPGAGVIKLLVVDDSALVRKLLGQVFSAQDDFEIAYARNGVEALDQLTSFAPDVITLDIHMPQMDGLACLDAIMMQKPTPVVMVSSLTEEGAQTSLEALRLGAIDFAAKPSGAVSLHLEQWGPELTAKVRAAAVARLPLTLRLKERVRHRIAAAALPASKASQPPAKPEPPASGDGLVLIGTSTGGPPALETVLTALPANFSWPILVAQHMPASFTGPLARRLDKLCALTVVEVLQPMLVEPGMVYIGRGEADLVVSRRAEGLVALSVPPADYPWHPSADRLVRTAMAHLPASQLIGVLMTGMGNDGAQAMAKLHEDGGRTIAESEETAVVWGMPGELVRAGGAGSIIPLPGIAAHLSALTPPCP